MDIETHLLSTAWMEQMRQQISPEAQHHAGLLLAQINKQLADLKVSSLEAFVRNIQSDPVCASSVSPVMDRLTRLQLLLETGAIPGGDWTRAEILRVVDVAPEEIRFVVGTMSDGDTVVGLSETYKTTSGLASVRHFMARVDQYSGRSTPLAENMQSLEQLVGVTGDGALVGWKKNGKKRDLVCVDVDTGRQCTMYQDHAPMESMDWSALCAASETVVSLYSLHNQIGIVHLADGRHEILPLNPDEDKQFGGVTRLGHIIIGRPGQIVYVDTKTRTIAFRVAATSDEHRAIFGFPNGGIVYAQDHGSLLTYWNPYEGIHKTFGVPKTKGIMGAVAHPDDPYTIAFLVDLQGNTFEFWTQNVATDRMCKVEINNDQRVLGIQATADGHIAVFQDRRILHIGERV